MKDAIIIDLTDEGEARLIKRLREILKPSYIENTDLHQQWHGWIREAVTEISENPEALGYEIRSMYTESGNPEWIDFDPSELIFEEDQ